MGWADTCDGDVKGHMRNSEDSNQPGEMVVFSYF